MPRQLHTRGDKLVYSNGILLLAGFAVPAARRLRRRPHAADPDVHRRRLHQLHASASGAWCGTGTGSCAAERDPAARRRMHRSRVINAIGGSLTTVVLVIIVLTKFTGGAWIVIAAMPLIFLLMRSINRHYSQRRRAAGARQRRADEAEQGARRRAGVEGAQADAARAGLRPGHPARRAHRADGQRRRRRHPGAAGGLGALRHPGAADRHRLAVPGDHPSGARLRPGHPPVQPARAGRRLRAAVRGRALVGERPAQPERAAAAHPAAVPARRDDHQRALAAGELAGPGRRRRRRARRRATCAGAHRRGPSRRRMAETDPAAPHPSQLAAGPAAGPNGSGGPAPVRGDRRARWRTAGTAWPGTRAGWSSCGTALPGERVRRRG